MASVVIRNIDDNVKATLQKRAKRHGRSLEAELRLVLTEVAAADVAATPPAEGFGTRLANLFAEFGLKDMDLEPLPREHREPIDFSK